MGISEETVEGIWKFEKMEIWLVSISIYLIKGTQIYLQKDI